MKHENLYLEILWGLCFHSSIKNVAPPKFFGAKILTFRKNMLLSCNEIIIYQYYQRFHSIKFLFSLTWGFTHSLAQYQLKYYKNGFNLNRGYQLWQSFIDIPTRESNDLANYHGWQLSSLVLVSLIRKKNCSGMVFKRKSYYNRYVPFNPNGGDFGLWKIVFWAAYRQSKRQISKYKIYNIKKNDFQALNVDVMLLMLKIVIIFENFQLTCNHLLFTTFPLFVSICKRSSCSKICGCCNPPIPLTRSFTLMET